MRSSAPTGTDCTVRSRQRLVNFGVVSLGCVLGDSRDALLTLRCECGAPGCSATIEATINEYRDDRCNRFMVARGHEVALLETVLSANERFAIVVADLQQRAV
jgi:hypothetical protein